MTLTFFIALQLILVFMKINDMILWEWVFVFMPWMMLLSILAIGNSFNIVGLKNYTNSMQRQLFSMKKWYVDKEK